MRSLTAAAALIGLAASVAWADTIDTTYQRLEEAAGRKFLVTPDGSWTLPPEVEAAHQRLLTFINGGDPIRLEIERGVITSITRREEGGVDERRPVDDAIDACERGDVVSIDGRPHRFLGADEESVFAAPQVPGTEDFEGRAELPRDRIRKFELIERGGASAPIPDDDAFLVAGVEVGDTVELRTERGPQRGQIADLNNATCSFRPWLGRVFGSGRELRRRDVKAVRRAPVVGTEQEDLGDGVVLELRIRRYIDKSQSEAGITVDARHGSSSTVVRGVRLGVTGQPISELLEPIPPGAVASTHMATFAITEDVTVDLGRLELLPLSDDAASAILVERLQAVERGQAEPALIYGAAAGSGREDLLHYLLTVAAGGAGLGPELQQAAREALKSSGGSRGGELATHELRASNARLERTVLERGRLEREAVPPPQRDDHRIGLLELVAALPGQLTPEQAAELLELGRDERYMPALGRLVTTRGADMAGPLLRALEAAEEGDEDTPAHRLVDLHLNREVLAGYLALQGVSGESAASLPELGERGAAAGIPALVALANLDEEVERLQELAAADELQEALDGIRAARKTDPGREDLRELRDEVATRLAREHLDAGERGQAALLLEEIVDRVDGARGPLAEAFLEAAQEALMGVPLRAQPHPAGDLRQTLPPGMALKGKPLERPKGWVEVTTRDGVGYVNLAEGVAQAQQGRYNTKGRVPRKAFVALLDRARKLDPGVGARADELLGFRYLDEAERAYEEENWAEVGSLLAQAEGKAPADDERFGLAPLAWWHANKMLLGLGAAGLFITMAVVIYIRSRHIPTVKVKSAEERAAEAAARAEAKAASGRHARASARVSSASQRALAGGGGGTAAKKIALYLVVAVLGGVILWQAYKVAVAFML